MKEVVHHDSAVKHVTGESVFIEDMDLCKEMLVGKVVYSKVAHARITSLDITEALKIKGVHAVLTAGDIPGKNQMGPVIADEPCLAEKEVLCIGQAIVLIAAESNSIAMEAQKLVRINYEPMEAILDLEVAIEKNNLLAPPVKIERGDVSGAISSAFHRLKGTLRTGAQEHWYLETQSALAVPGEGKEMLIHASSQHPSETQTIVAEVLGIKKHEVEVEVRRIGGAFGGKETQGNHVAAWAALLARATGRPVKIHLFRDDDQIMTGKRHRFISDYEIGFNENGKILAYSVDLHADAGIATDLSMAILMRALLHAENAYYIPDIVITGKAYRTNLPSNTAFWGFGGPQVMAVIENAIDRVARFLKKDPAGLRYLNFYRDPDHVLTPYGKRVENNHLSVMFEKLIFSSGYHDRRKEIDRFNNENEFYKRGIALTPVKFGISFTTSFLNQAGALVHIYTDGTVLVNHGGTEMGQGLHTKILQVASEELGLSADKVRVSATNTSKVPNTSATAASSGSDMNGMAVKNAIDILKSRITPVAAEEMGKRFPGKPCDAGNLVFSDGFITDKTDPLCRISFEEAVKLSYLKRISLSSTGYYRTPGVWFDQQAGKGNPFFYYAFGMAVSEVMIDTLTGGHTLLRTDILHDAGDTINEAIDTGQITGGFIQGVGWCTIEEIKWDPKGNLMTHSPDTYKIPTINDIPVDFRVDLLWDSPNPGTIRGSKAVGEPPFMLAFSVWLAIKDAISAVGNHETEPDFSLPATYEVILQSAEKLKK
jgi:xanthine dehydrogenase large subunit